MLNRLRQQKHYKDMCCGIAGGMNIRKATVEKMLERQHSRGPDHTGIEQIGNVIFGHNRLAIIDKSERSNQPIFGGGTMLTYNGEFYNYDSKLESDTISLFSKFFARYSTDDSQALPINKISILINEINGMFAFGFYRDDTIILVRDRFGIKPLYFTHQKDYFAFASTPAALSLTKDNWKISEKGLQEYLSLGATMLHSMFDGIDAVPPGYYLTYNIKTHSYKLTRWYYPKFIENAKETIKEKVRQAIDRVKLTCDWPQITLLSGGVDSTIVSSRYLGGNAIHLQSPEREYAEQAAKKFNLNLLDVTPTIESAEEGLTDFITKSGEPTMAGLIPWITCKEIAKQGYRVAITANGADELFFGYDRMKGHTHEQRSHIFREFSFSDELMFQMAGDYQPQGFNMRQWLEVYSYLAFDLNKTLDYASMCHSVEVRVPYLDHELVEAALSIPMEQHIGRYGNKTILKEMLLELGFDYDFIHRPKVGFSLHHEPSDLANLKRKAMDWYKKTGYEQLPLNATGRQQSYHESAMPGLYLWHKIYGHE